MRLFVALAVLAASATFASAQVPADPHDVTTYPVVYQVPGMAEVDVQADIAYGTGERGPVHLDLYRPRGGPGPWPVVVFANGVGDVGPRRLKDWEIYRSWARLMAAHGVAGVTMEAEGGRTAERIAQVVEHLRRNGHSLGVDPDRVALWACSANVPPALPYAMGDAPLRAAVFYYGTGNASRLRTDLPVLYVMAGKDAPNLNEGIRRLWSAAAQQTAPWTMVLARDLPHAFDGLVESRPSRELVSDTVEFLVRELRPREPAGSVALARRALAHSYGLEWPQAAEAYALIAKEEPRNATVRRQLGRALARSGKPSEATAELRRAMEMGEDGAGLHLEMAGLLLASGRHAEAVIAYDAAVARGGPAGVASYNAACALAHLGRVDEAFARLEKAVAAGFTSRAQFENDDDLKPLHADPRWSALLTRLE